MTNEQMIERIEKLKVAKDELLEQIHRVIIGQDEVIEQLLIGLLPVGIC